MKSLLIAIAAFFTILVTTYLFFLSPEKNHIDQSKVKFYESGSEGSAKHRSLGEIPKQSKTLEFSQEVEVQVTEENSTILPIREKQDKIIDIHINLMKYLNKNGGNIDKLSLEQKLAFAKALQFCGTRPIHDTDALEQEKNALHFSSLPPETNSYHEELCRDVPEILIYESYSLIKDAAEGGDQQSILTFYHALPPDLLKALMNGNYLDEEEYQVSLEHFKLSGELIIDAIYEGNVGAALAVAHDIKKGHMFEQDSKKSLAYYIAANAHYKSGLIKKMINLISEELNQSEIDEANTLADDLINHWQAIGGIYI